MELSVIKSAIAYAFTNIIGMTFFHKQAVADIWWCIFPQSFNRISKLASVSRSFITTIAAEGSYIGIVQFTSEGTRLSGLTLIDSDDTRNELAGLIPTSAVGGTCIGCGLETALQVKVWKWIRNTLILFWMINTAEKRFFLFMTKAKIW